MVAEEALRRRVRITQSYSYCSSLPCIFVTSVMLYSALANRACRQGACHFSL